MLILEQITELSGRASQGCSYVLDKYIPVLSSRLWDKWNPSHPQIGPICHHLNLGMVSSDQI